MHTRHSYPFIAALFLLALAPAALPADEGAESRRTITVSGRGEVTAAPDRVIVSFAVDSTAPKAADAVAENATRSARVAAALKALIGQGDTLTTTRYSLDPHYEQPKPGQPSEPRITGYVAHNDVQVESHNVDGAGALIDAATAAGANRVSSLQFTLSNRDAQLRAALAQAGAEARAQAESVATALGVELARVLSATTSAGPIVQPHVFAGRAMAAMEASAPTPIEAGTVSVVATLQVTYEIK